MDELTSQGLLWQAFPTPAEPKDKQCLAVLTFYVNRWRQRQRPFAFEIVDGASAYQAPARGPNQAFGIPPARDSLKILPKILPTNFFLVQKSIEF